MASKTVIAAFLVGIAQAASPVAAQKATWTNRELTVWLTFPTGWSKADPSSVRLYSPDRDPLIPANLFHRPAGGVFRKRYITGYFRLLAPTKRSDMSVEDAARVLEQRMRSSQKVVLADYSSRRGFPILAFRFQHTGTPVTQAIVLFADAFGRLYSIEITGHRSDETLLIGEAKQIAHSLVVEFKPAR